MACAQKSEFLSRMELWEFSYLAVAIASTLLRTEKPFLISTSFRGWRGLGLIEPFFCHCYFNKGLNFENKA